jgi:hypothetical protein
LPVISRAVTAGVTITSRKEPVPAHSTTTVLMIEPQTDAMDVMRHGVLALSQAAINEALMLSSNVRTLSASDRNPQPTVGLLAAVVAKYSSKVSSVQGTGVGAWVGEAVGPKVVGAEVGGVDGPHSKKSAGHSLVCGTAYPAQMPLAACLQLPSDPPLQSSMAQRTGVVVAVVVAVVDTDELPVEV